MVTNTGSGYPNGTFYTSVRGDGTGGVVALVVGGGQITVFGSNNATNTYLHTFGSGYSFASISLASGGIFTDLDYPLQFLVQLLLNGILQQLGSITPIIAPLGGHGDDDIEELGGHFVMVQGKFEPADADVTQVNDFRRVGIVKKSNCKW